MPSPATADSAKLAAFGRVGLRLLSRVVPTFAAWLIQRLAFSPARPRIRAAESVMLARGRKVELIVSGQEMAGWSWGSGPTVVLVHGWSGHAAHMTAFVDPLVNLGYRAVALDMPGHGSSAGRQSSIVHFSKALKELSLYVGEFEGLIAHSLGAAAGIYAMASGLQVRRAVFFAPPARFDGIWQRLQQSNDIPAPVLDRVIRNSERWLNLNFASVAPVSLASRVRVPSLIVHDEMDREIFIGQGLEVARSMHDGKLYRTSGLGHLRILKDPATVAAAVSFIAGKYPSAAIEELREATDAAHI
jgi:pimeloyl-ACP methyl ester carboxylesterase